MRRLLERSLFAVLTITMAACTSVGDAPGSGGNGGGGAGGVAANGGSGGDAGTGGNNTPAPEVTLTATPKDVPTGDEAELVWEVKNAESCAASDGWGGLRNKDGGSEVRPIFDDRRFELTCTGPGGKNSAEANVDLSTSQLQVTINFNYYLVLPGQTFDVNVTVANPGTAMVSGVTTVLTIPQYVLITADELPPGAGCTDMNADENCDMVDWPIGNVDGGSVTEVSLSPLVDPRIPEDEPIQFRVDTTADDGKLPTVTTDKIDEGESDLTLALNQSPSQAQAGDLLIYGLSYGNTGTDLLENVVLILTLPKHTALAGTPAGNPDVGDGTVSWDVGTLMPGEQSTVEAVANVDPTLPPGVPLQARADGQATKNGEPIFTRAGVQAVVSEGPIVISANLTPNRVGVGDRMDLPITISNPGVDPITDLTVQLQIPEGIDGFSTSRLIPIGTCGNNFCDPGETVTWTGLTVPAGESIVLWATYLGSSGAAQGDVISMRASVWQGGTVIGETVATALKETRTLDLRLAATSAPVSPGSTVTYALDFANQTGSTITDGSVTMGVPIGTVLANASDDGEINSEGAVEWSLDGLGPNQGGTRYAVIQLPDSLADGAQIRANATGVVSGAQVASATTSTTVEQPKVVATVEVSPDRLIAGERSNVAVTLKNVSGERLTDVDIRLILPESITGFSTSELSTGSPPSIPACGNNFCDPGEVAAWSNLTIEDVDTVTVTAIPKMLAAGQLASFVTDVRVRGQHAAVASATTRGDDSPAIELELVESAHPVSPESRLTYTLHFVNKSLLTQSGTLTLTIPDGTEFASATDTGVRTGKTIGWTFSQLGPGQGGTRQLVVDVNEGGGTLPAVLRADAVALVQGDVRIVRATANTPIGSRRLVGRVELSPDPDTVGERMDVAVTISNPGADPVTEIAAKLRLPQGIGGFSTVELSNSGFSMVPDCGNNFCDGGETVRWRNLSLEGGASVTVTLAPWAVTDFLVSGSVDSLMPFTLELTATDQSTLMAGATAVVDDLRELQLRLDENANPASPGDTLIYTVHYANQTSSTVTQRLTLTIPRSVEFISATDGVEPNAEGVIEWTSIIVPARKGGTREVVVEATALANPAGSQLRAEAQAIILDDGSDTAGRRARATAQTPVGTTDLQLVVLAPEVADQDDPAPVEVQVTNIGTSTINDIVTRVRLPQNIDGFSTNTLSHPGACGNNFCDPGETVTFSSVSLGMNESITFTIPANVDAAAPLGALLTFSSELVISGGPLPLPSAAGTVRVCSGSGCP